jgi:hypothetical protein
MPPDRVSNRHPRGVAQILRSTLWTIVEQPDFEGSGRHFDAVVHEELRPPVPSRRSDPGGRLNFEINPMDQSESIKLRRLRTRCGRGRRCASRRSDPGDWQNFEINPMDHSRATRLQNLRQAPRCGARTRGGTPCQRPAIRGRKRCRLHGGLSPGAPRGEKNGNFKTGDWTLDAIEERKWLRSLVRSFCKGSK